MLFAPAVVCAAVCVAAMWSWPGEETIPYHLGYALFGLAYGLDPWPRSRAFTALGLYTVLTGGVLVTRAGNGVIDWQETTEIPLMCLLMALMMWHVRNRQAALAEVTRLAALDRARAKARELLARMTSHEMRTPLTIATGYVDLLLTEEPEGSRRADLEVVRDELDRLSRASDRLLRMIRFHDHLPQQLVDLDELLRQTGRRWAAVVDRDWRVEVGAGSLLASPERVRACLDTLIENAVRYTSDGQTVRLFARRESGEVWMGVADAGRGFDPDKVAAINAPGERVSGAPDTDSVDPLAQTGLGLELVRRIVGSRGGRVVADRGPDGGARIAMVLPVEAPSLLAGGAGAGPDAAVPGGAEEAWVHESGAVGR